MYNLFHSNEKSTISLIYMIHKSCMLIFSDKDEWLKSWKWWLWLIKTDYSVSNGDILFYYLTWLLEKLLGLAIWANTWGNEGAEMRGNSWIWALKIWSHSEDSQLTIRYVILVTKLKQKDTCVILDCCFDLFEKKKRETRLWTIKLF